MLAGGPHGGQNPPQQVLTLAVQNMATGPIPARLGCESQCSQCSQCECAPSRLVWSPELMKIPDVSRPSGRLSSALGRVIRKRWSRSDWLQESRVLAWSWAWPALISAVGPALSSRKQVESGPPPALLPSLVYRNS